MKKYLLVIMALIAFSCDEETTYSVDPSLQVYVDSFHSAAADNGITLPKDNLIVQLSESRVLAEVIIKAGQKYIDVNKQYAATCPGVGVEYEIHQALAVVYFGRHLSGTIMSMPQYQSLPYAKLAYTDASKSAILNSFFAGN